MALQAYGGEEFLVLLPENAAGGGEAIASGCELAIATGSSPAGTSPSASASPRSRPTIPMGWTRWSSPPIERCTPPRTAAATLSYWRPERKERALTRATAQDRR